MWITNQVAPPRQENEGGVAHVLLRLLPTLDITKIWKWWNVGYKINIHSQNNHGNMVVLRDIHHISIKYCKKQKIAYKSKYEELRVYTPYVSYCDIYTSV